MISIQVHFTYDIFLKLLVENLMCVDYSSLLCIHIFTHVAQFIPIWPIILTL